MIIWVNGTFGVGKTTTANHLVARSEQLRLFDPETVGSLLAHHLSDHEFSDFQQLTPWRALVPVVADELACFTGQHLVAVQTVLDEGCWREIRDGLAARDHRVRHVVLDADAGTLRSRIDADPEGHDIRGWRHDHIEPYLAARSWLLEDADLVLDTSAIRPDEAAEKVLIAFPVDLDTAKVSTR